MRFTDTIITIGAALVAIACKGAPAARGSDGAPSVRAPVRIAVLDSIVRTQWLPESAAPIRNTEISGIPGIRHLAITDLMASCGASSGQEAKQEIERRFPAVDDDVPGKDRLDIWRFETAPDRCTLVVIGRHSRCGATGNCEALYLDLVAEAAPVVLTRPGMNRVITVHVDLHDGQGPLTLIAVRMMSGGAAWNDYWLRIAPAPLALIYCTETSADATSVTTPVECPPS